MTSKSIAQVAEYRSLRLCGIEELAAHQLNRAPSPGVAFARKTERTQKDIARQEVLNLFSPNNFPNGLSILSMPGVDWKFERKLLGWREGDWFRKKGPHRTYLTTIENDRSIYHASIVTMPGLEPQRANSSRATVVVLASPAFAESVVRNPWVCRHFFGNVDDLMASGYWHGDGAWLDYTGPLSTERLCTIAKFFNEGVRSTLVVTALKARWNKQTSRAIDAAGGHTPWVTSCLHGAAVVHAIEYQDGASPMAQLAFRKETA